MANRTESKTARLTLLLDPRKKALFEEICAAQDLTPSQVVRQLIREHQLAAAVPTPGGGQKVPAALIMDGEIVKGVPGVLTVLHDAGYEDREVITWLFTADDTLPGRPVDALRENRGSEVKRRAQAMGF